MKLVQFKRFCTTLLKIERKKEEGWLNAGVALDIVVVFVHAGNRRGHTGIDGSERGCWRWWGGGGDRTRRCSAGEDVRIPAAATVAGRRGRGRGREGRRRGCR